MKITLLLPLLIGTKFGSPTVTQDQQLIWLHPCALLVWWQLYKYKCLWDVGGKVGIQVSRRKLHTYIHLN